MSTCSYTLEPCIGVSHLKEERGRSEQKASSSTLGLYPWCQCALQAQSRPPTRAVNNMDSGMDSMGLDPGCFTHGFVSWEVI